MSACFPLRVLTPAGIALDVETSSVVLPGEDGSLGIMAGHQPILVALRPGTIQYRDEADVWQSLSIPGGTAGFMAGELRLLTDEVTTK